MKPFLAICLILSAVFANEDKAALIKDIKQSLMAPCCWSGTVYDHGHSQMEMEIDEFVEAGRTKEEILNYYVGIYGERILAVPVASGFNLFAWIVPVIIAGIGVLILILFLKTPSQAPVPVSQTKSDIPFDDQIEKELKELD